MAKHIKNTKSHTLLSGTGGNDSIKNGGYWDSSNHYGGSSVTINTGAGNDSVENYYGNSVSINTGAGNDSVENNGSSVTITGGAGNDTIYNNCYRESDGSIYYYDGYFGFGSNVLFKYSSGDGNDVVYGFKADSTLSIGGGSYSTTKSGDNMVVTVGKGKISLIGAASLSKVNIKGTKAKTSTTKTVTNSTKSPVTVGSAIKTINASSRTKAVKITGNNLANSITGGSGKDTIYGGKGDDRIILENNPSKNLIKYSAGEGNDIIYGFNGTSTLSVSGSYSTQSSGNDIIVKAGSGRITLKNVYASADKIHINGNTTSNSRKTITLTSGNYDNVYISRNSISVVGSAQADWINNYGDKVTIKSGKGDDWISNYDGDKVSINAGAGADNIYSSGEDATIIGGSGNDSIYLAYNAENNVLLYNSGDGNDSISGFSSDDTLKIAASSYSTKKSGSNVIVTVGKGKITLAGAATLSSVHISKTGSSGGSTSSTTKTVTNSTKSPVTVGSAIKTVNASSRTKAVKITGNSLANTITGGSGKDTIYGGKGNDSILGGKGNDRLYGQKGNDTLWGGAGNDSLLGGSGNDTFIYKAGEGSDKIFDYSAGDMLKILKSNGKSGGKFTKSKYSNGTLALTISGGGSVLFDNVTTSTNFNINGKSYKISGSKLVKK